MVGIVLQQIHINKGLKKFFRRIRFSLKDNVPGTHKIVTLETMLGKAIQTSNLTLQQVIMCTLEGKMFYLSNLSYDTYSNKVSHSPHKIGISHIIFMVISQSFTCILIVTQAYQYKTFYDFQQKYGKFPFTRY